MKIKYVGVKARFRRLPFGVLIFVILASGCSPGMFFGGRDEKVMNTPRYRKINPACADINLSTSTISVTDFRNILNCLNSNSNSQTGNLTPIQKLVNSLKDEELKPVIDKVNRDVLNDKSKLYRIEQTYYALNEKKRDGESVLVRSLDQLGKLLKNVDLIINFVAILEEGRVLRPSDGVLVPDEKLLKSFELFSRELTNENFKRALDVGSNFAGAPALESLQKRFKNDSLSGRTLRQLTDDLLKYLKEHHTYKTDRCGDQWVPIRNEFFQAINDEEGRFFTFLNQSLGTDTPPEGTSQKDWIKSRVQDLAVIFEATLKPQSASSSDPVLLEKLSGAFKDLNIPIQCLYEGKTIPNAAMHIFREISELPSPSDSLKYVLRDNRLNMVSMAPFCTFPKSLSEHYETLVQTAELGVMPSMAQLMKLLYKDQVFKWNGCDGKTASESNRGEDYHLLAQLFINFLADQGNDPATGIAGGGFSHLIPALREITERGAWIDLLLLAASPNDLDRAQIEKTVKFIMKPMPELDGENIFTVMTEVASRTSLASLYPFVQSVAKVFQGEDSYFEPSLKMMREIYYVNDAHPFLDLLRETLGEASESVEFFNALFLIAGKKDFRDSLTLLSEMSSDGSLKELMEVVVRLFHKFALEGKVAVNKVEEPQFKSNRRHEFRSSSAGDTQDDAQIENKNLVEVSVLAPLGSDRTRLAVSDASSVGVPVRSTKTYDWYVLACKNLKVNFSWADHTFPDYDEQFENYWNCLNGVRNPVEGNLPVNLLPSQNHGQLDVGFLMKDSVEFLQVQPVEGQNQSYFDFGLDLTHRLFSSLPSKDIAFMVDAGVTAFDEGHNGRFYHLMNAFPLLVQGSAESGHVSDSSTSVLKPLFNAVGTLMSRVPNSIRALEELGGRLVGWADFSKVIGDAYDFWDEVKLDRAQPSTEVDRNTPFDALMTPAFKEKIRQWVDYKECADYPLTMRNRRQAIDARVEEIIEEARSNVSTWDLVPSGANGRRRNETRKSWSLAKAKELLEPGLYRIALGSMASSPDSLLLDAPLKFFKYFTLPPSDNPDFGARMTQFSHYDPNYFLEWFYKRALDYRLILYYYPGEDNPRVRLVNTVDLFELVVWNVDMLRPALGPLPVPEVGKNMALDYMTVYATAWGDVPREKWPPEIQRMYPRNRRGPRTLLDATYNIVDRMNNLHMPYDGFSNIIESVRSGIGMEDLQSLTFRIVGTPKLPQCYLDRRMPGDDAIVETPYSPHEVRPVKALTVQSTQTWSDGGLAQAGLRLAGVDIKDFKRRIFNLWQVNQVLPENSPGNTEGEYNKGGGLEVMRDLFFEVYKTTRDGEGPGEKDRYRKATAGDDNNLSILLRGMKLGGMSQIAKQVQKFWKPDPQNLSDPAWPTWNALQDFFVTLVHSGASPSTRPLAEKLLTDRLDYQHDLIWNMVKEVFDLIDQKNEHPEYLAQMKQLAFYMMASMNKLEPWIPNLDGINQGGQQPDLMELMMATANEVMGVRENRQFFETHGSWLSEGLKSQRASQLARVVYEEQAGAERFKRLAEFLKQVLADSETGMANPDPGLHAMALLRSIEERNPPGTVGPTIRDNLDLFKDRFDAMRSTREYTQLELKKAVDPIILFLAQRPQEGTAEFSEAAKEASQHLLANFATSLKKNDLSQFLVLAGDQRRSTEGDRTNSEKFYQVLENMARLIGRGESSPMKDFLKKTVVPSLNEKR